MALGDHVSDGRLIAGSSMDHCHSVTPTDNSTDLSYWNGPPSLPMGYVYAPGAGWAVPPTTQQQEGKPKMRGLFEVYFVDPELGEEVGSWRVVARDADSAKLKAFRLGNWKAEIDDYDIIVRRLGDVRPKREIQEVKVVR